VDKRLVTTFEWPIPQYFSPVKGICPDGSTVFVMIAAEELGIFKRGEKAQGR